MTQSNRRVFGVLLLLLVIPTIAWAASSTVKWTLTLADPLREQLGPSAERREKIADEAMTRLEARLSAAQVNDAVVKRHDIDLTVEFRAKRDIAWYRALLTAPGHVEILPVTPEAFDWMDLAAQVPSGVEFRGENPRPDFIWSSDRSSLERVLSRTTVVGVKLVVGPDVSGWRSYALGATSVGSSEDFKSTKVRRGAGGNAYVAATISSSIADRLAAAEHSEVKDWAVVLDGEVVDVISREALLMGKLEMSPPKRLTSRDEAKAWAQQVAGRMAAPLQVQIAVVQE